MKKHIHNILKKGEKIFKTDLIYLAKGGAWLTFAQMIATFSGLFVTVVFANLLTEETFGTYKFVLSLSGVVAIFSLTGMGSAITRAVSRGNEGILKQALKLSLKWSLLMIVISLGLALYYFLQGNNILALSMVFVSIFAPLIQSFSLYISFINGKKDFKTRSFFNLSFSIIPTTILITTVLITQDPLIIIFMFFLSRAFIHIVHYYITVKKYKPNTKEDKCSIGYGKHLSFMNILGGLAFQLDKILVFHYLGAAQLALYAIALAPPQQLRYLNKMIGTMSLPRFSQRAVGTLQKNMARKALLLLGLTSIVVVLYILSAPFIYALFFPKYIDAVIYSQVFSLIMLFFPSVLFQQALIAHMQKKQLYILQTFIPILKILLLLFLLPLFGIWGALASMFCTETLRLVLVIYFFRSMKKNSV